jgi:hypothetical protein
MLISCICLAFIYYYHSIFVVWFFNFIYKNLSRGSVKCFLSTKGFRGQIKLGNTDLDKFIPQNGHCVVMISFLLPLCFFFVCHNPNYLLPNRT